MKKWLAALALALFTAPLLADIELSTSINDVFHRGDNELAGSITMRVNANDFNGASTSEPVFIRITLDHNARLSQTLVNLNSTNTLINDPIYLAMVLNTNSASLVLNADPQTTSIVRWVAQESSFWIRVQSDSSDWIEILGTGGLTQPPEDEDTVAWTLGISARNSYESLRNIPVALKNLPYNTRNAAASPGTTDVDDSTSTLICVDLTTSDLDTTGVESLLNFDPIAFDSTAELSLGNYRPGNDTGINFTNDFAIARGKRRECTVTIGKGAATAALLCIPRASTNESQAGFISLTNVLNFIVRCRRGGDFLDTDLLDGAYVTLSTGSRGVYGFQNDGTAASFVGTPTAGIPVVSGAFGNNGRTFYTTVDLVWNGGFVALDNFGFGVQATVWYHYTNPPTEVILDWAITLVNHDGARDDDSRPVSYTYLGSFEGDDQFIRCPPSEFEIASGVWNFGFFLECTGNPVSIFFPYVPRLRDTLFWTGLSVVNQGFVDLPNVQAILYNSEGKRFAADFPPLPVRNQYTWLLTDDGVDTGFFGTEAYEDQVLVPVPSDPDVPAESFGDTRMSMFVVGTFSATFLDEVFNGDLDGYLLIGRDNDVDGSYLPRNYDNDIPGQNADLPLRRSKQGSVTTAVEVNEIGPIQPATYWFQGGRLIQK